MRWTGSFMLGNLELSLGCWDTITKCIKDGIVIDDMRGARKRYAQFEVNAKEG
jgi:hypothetical protein